MGTQNPLIDMLLMIHDKEEGSNREIRLIEVSYVSVTITSVTTGQCGA